MIAYLGLGLLGSNFVRAMVRRGEKVQVWNRSPDRARALEAEGVRAFDRVEDAVRGASRVHLTLSDDAAVDDVLGRALSALAPGAVVLDHTTTSSAGTGARAARLEAAGISFLHTPVFMGPSNARDATGIMLASGPRERFELVRPELEKMTGRLVYLGPDPARAAVFKLLGNLFLIEMVGSMVDVFSLARSAGVTPADAVTLFDLFNPAAAIGPRAQRMLDGQFDDPSWTLEMARKDVRLMLETGERSGAHFIELPGIAREMDAWLARGNAKRDWMVIAQDAVKKP
ncbi:MAG TPA: NAD(P)-binding domain-containing protein [Polyangiaceae bacterium]|nr:NAD(P)-binding domain-containing protein [Polyangiaceae bacterium]